MLADERRADAGAGVPVRDAEPVVVDTGVILSSGMCVLRLRTGAPAPRSTAADMLRWRVGRGKGLDCLLGGVDKIGRLFRPDGVVGCGRWSGVFIKTPAGVGRFSHTMARNRGLPQGGRVPVEGPGR